jgi:DNA-binding response OmpR family regulator
MKKLLVIDDEIESTDIIKMCLDASEFHILGISEPQNAIRTIFDFSPELILLDWVMPEKEGLVVLKEIKSMPELQSIPIIISTGIRTQSEDLRSALEAGASDFIRKPVDEIELQARIRSILKIEELHKQSFRMQKEIHEKELEIAETKARALQQELSKREKEMLVAAVEIFQSKRLLSAIKSDIFSTETLAMGEFRHYVEKVLIKYENESNCFNWQLFEKRFVEVNSDFYYGLRKDFPELTSGELRICAYQKTGMSIKEIAILNYSNYEAIRKAVYRIRKKLHLDEKTNLAIFLQNY